MKFSHILVLTFVIAIIGFVFYSLSGGQTDEGYAQTILKEREEKDAFMKGGDSPLRSVRAQADEEKDAFMKSEASPFADSAEIFTGLKYFPPDVKYRITANLETVEDKKVVVLPTSDGKEQKYLEYAYATFSMDGIENKLLILEIMDMGPQRGKLFLSFADATSSEETYGAGRYLDVKKVPGATSITLDFNQAYNPYCAYSNAFSCPFPPKENILNIAIKAGEMSYH